MKTGKRVIIIVLDSVGVGYLEDAADFGDVGSNTLKNTSESVGGLYLPTLGKLGIGNIIDIKGVSSVINPTAKYGKIREKSKGKDTMTGHWEMMGIISEKPFPVYHDGFPDEIIDEFKKRIGVDGVLGNVPASGTEIIKELGAQHIKTGFPIVYTSGDSVFQIASHTDVIPLKTLYEYCEEAREMCNKYNIGRVIARPFAGDRGAFKRTSDRRDFPMVPPEDTILDLIKSKGLPVVGIGKIEDIYVKRGLTKAIHTKNNDEGMDVLEEEMNLTKGGVIFINLVDFDMLFGHRRDPKGYAKALEKFDERFGGILSMMKEDDIMMITADHGCDPTFKGTDHTREFIPILIYGNKIKPDNLGIRRTFADIGITALSYLGIDNTDFPGESMI